MFYLECLTILFLHLFFVIIVQILVSIYRNLSDYYKGLLKSSV
ncbi:hypothetical protein CLOSTHATH_00734 [Hungatella hathewayi DSM 13479]|uniref:Uncharacterized protein n=1 Tax=Hungatella hathewayi DSM 13479 TaxID=566550 RepID=D3AAW3_9FIRM|nr:hypothetical protein CLOSTHATH_00734 [Hungatella hathewayi DSM 13479]